MDRAGGFANLNGKSIFVDSHAGKFLAVLGHEANVEEILRQTDVRTPGRITLRHIRAGIDQRAAQVIRAAATPDIAEVRSENSALAAKHVALGASAFLGVNLCAAIGIAGDGFTRL